MDMMRKLPELQVATFGGLLNGVWEFMHSPLYADHANGLWYVIWTRLHCTVGDVMIMLCSFWGTSLLFRSRVWMRQSGFVTVFCFSVLGLGYTIYSEWYNTTVSKTWQYAASMPELWGIGLSPILQWVVLPPAVVYLARRCGQTEMR